MEAREKAKQVYLMAHELVHPMIDRTRFAAGIVEPDDEPAGGAELARYLCRTIADEYWADYLADVVLNSAASTPVDAPEANVTWSLLGDRHRGPVFVALNDAYPKWPDTVQRYRIREIELQPAWLKVGRSLNQTLIALVHAQALADCAWADANSEPVNLLEAEPLSGLPAVKIYLQEPWGRFLVALRQSSLLCRVTTFQSREEEILQAGEQMLVEIWARLGFRFTKLSDNGYYLAVAEPQR